MALHVEDLWRLVSMVKMVKALQIGFSASDVS